MDMHGEKIAWCERRSAEALPAVRAALSTQAQPAQQAEDTLLLNWLEENPARDVSYWSGVCQWRATEDERVVGRGQTLREAIRSALSALPNGGER